MDGLLLLAAVLWALWWIGGLRLALLALWLVYAVVRYGILED